MNAKAQLENQIGELERIHNKIETIINHEHRYLLDALIVDYVISQRNKIDLALHISTFSLNNTDEALLRSIYDANSGLSLELLESQLDYYIDLITIKGIH